MKTVLGYLRPHAGRVAAGAAIKFTAAVLELILPLLLAEVIDELVPAGDTAAIWRTGGWMSLLPKYRGAAIFPPTGWPPGSPWR